jgi:hypothetical protein
MYLHVSDTLGRLHLNIVYIEKGAKDLQLTTVQKCMLTYPCVD